MQLPRRQFLHLAAGAAALPAVSRIAQAQTFPTRPITIVVPFPAGGPSDTISRILAERMRVSLGQPVITENTTGAAGSIGTGRVARAAGDGYTLVLGSWATQVVNGATYSLQYDLLADFEPVILTTIQPLVILAKKSMPAQDLRQLIAYLRANPDKATMANSGTGSASHVAGVFFQKQTGTRFQQIPYRGGAPALQDVIAGQIDLMIELAANGLPHARAGSVKSYAVTARSRVGSAPDIPTADEAGLPGFYISLWQAFWAPKNTPKAIIAKLNAAVVDALADATVRKRLADLGQEIPPPDQQTPEALGAFHKAEIEKWWPIIKAANIKGE